MTQLRPLTQADLASMGVISRPKASKEVQREVQGRPLSGSVEAPAYEISDVFSYQSYFDSTLSERALFRQNPNEPIVKSTLSNPIQVAGYGLALHPSSETPVAVQFETGAQQGRSQTYRLKPGEVIRPEGTPVSGGKRKPGFFTGFTWGLPFGWLGGGSATLVVLRSPDANVIWGADHNEVVYHRIRLKIWNPADPEFPVSAGPPAVYNGPINWPQRFPWPFATFGSTNVTQRGQPALALNPTRTALSLRVATIALGPVPGDGTFRMYWVGADVWAQTGPISVAQQVGTIDLSDVRATDQVWGTWVQQAGAPAPFNSAFQTMLLTGEAERYAANAGALLIASLDPQLQNQFTDIVRWGRL